MAQSAASVRHLMFQVHRVSSPQFKMINSMNNESCLCLTLQSASVLFIKDIMEFFEIFSRNQDMPHLQQVYLTLLQEIEVNLAQLVGREFCVCFWSWPICLTKFSCISSLRVLEVSWMLNCLPWASFLSTGHLYWSFSQDFKCNACKMEFKSMPCSAST